MCMKYILIIAVAVTVLISCKKDKNNVYKEYAGKWELKSKGGLFVQFFPPGNGNILILEVNRVYKRFQSDTLKFTGSYTIENLIDCDKASDKVIVSDSLGPNRMLVGLFQDSTLYFYQSECIADGLTITYRRVN